MIPSKLPVPKLLLWPVDFCMHRLCELQSLFLCSVTLIADRILEGLFFFFLGIISKCSGQVKVKLDVLWAEGRTQEWIMAPNKSLGVVGRSYCPSWDLVSLLLKSSHNFTYHCYNALRFKEKTYWRSEKYYYCVIAEVNFLKLQLNFRLHASLSHFYVQVVPLTWLNLSYTYWRAVAMKSCVISKVHAIIMSMVSVYSLHKTLPLLSL